MLVEILYRVFKKILIVIYKLSNYQLYRKKVILYGIPKLINSNYITIEENVRINDSVFIHGAGHVLIKENVTLSYGVSIISTGYDTNNWNENKINKQHINKKVTIGKNVWLCANVTVLPGVMIAEDIIVAAGSVVTNDLLESGYIYGGVPAKKIKKIT